MLLTGKATIALEGKHVKVKDTPYIYIGFGYGSMIERYQNSTLRDFHGIYHNFNLDCHDKYVQLLNIKHKLQEYLPGRATR